MKNCIVAILALVAVVSVQSGVLQRNRRGFLSRTGICPVPSANPTVADVRLNYLGFPIVLHKPDCTQSECAGDSHCDGDRKCCANRCGAKVCTSAVRDPDPCKYIRCPRDETCKVRKVKCVMPDCESGDVLALGKPTCIKDPNAPKRPPQAPVAAAPQAGNQQTPTYATTFPGCTQPPCQAPMFPPAPMMPAAPVAGCMQPPCGAPAPVMFADDQSQAAAPLMQDEPQQDMQQPQQDMQQPLQDMQQPQQFLQQPQQDMQQPQQDMQQPLQDMQQAQQQLQQPQPDTPQQQDKPQENAEQTAPLEDLDAPQQQQQPQVQPMYPTQPQQVVQQQYAPQAQWDKKH